MTYCELKDLSEIKGVTLQSLADEVNMTRTGFRSSIENQTLPISKVGALCKKIGISPNDFFSWKSNTAPQQIQTGCVGNAQYMDTRAVDLLQEQLSIKDKQLCEAQEQISRLINLLSR